MKVLFMLLICIQAVLAEEECGLAGIQRKMMVCQPFLFELATHLSSHKTELCASDTSEKVVDCVGAIVDECKNDPAYPSSSYGIVLETLKNLRNSCPPRDNDVKQSCDLEKWQKCVSQQPLPITALNDRKLAGNFDATDFMKRSCRLKDCIPLGRGCPSIMPTFLDLMEDELNFVCDGEGGQAIRDLESCVNDGQWFEFVDCSAGNPCEDITAFKVKSAQCSYTHLMNYSSCGVRSVNAVDVFSSKLVELLEGYCSKVYAKPKRGLNIQSQIDRIYTLFEESKLRPHHVV